MLVSSCGISTKANRYIDYWWVIERPAVIILRDWLINACSHRFYHWATYTATGSADWLTCRTAVSSCPDVGAECFVFGRQKRGKPSERWEPILPPSTPLLLTPATYSQLPSISLFFFFFHLWHFGGFLIPICWQILYGFLFFFKGIFLFWFF